jgi:hypothetical protein
MGSSQSNELLPTSQTNKTFAQRFKNHMRVEFGAAAHEALASSVSLPITAKQENILRGRVQNLSRLRNYLSGTNSAPTTPKKTNTRSRSSSVANNGSTPSAAASRSASAAEAAPSAAASRSASAVEAAPSRSSTGSSTILNQQSQFGGKKTRKRSKQRKRYSRSQRRP